MKRKSSIWIVLSLMLVSSALMGQDVENEMSYRTALQLNYEISKDLKLSFEPQVRFDNDLSIDKSLLEFGLEYEIFDILYWGADYRLIISPQEDDPTEYYNRIAFGLTAKKKFGRFSPSLRLQYSNYADDEVSDKEFLRYKAGVKYNIPKCKITPFVSVEAFQELADNKLYKMRYSSGLSYKIKKNNYINVSYKLDYFNLEYKNKHIIEVAYKYNF